MLHLPADRFPTPPAPALRPVLGLILLYFVLQAVVGFVVALLIGLGARLLRGPADVAALMSRPDLTSTTVIATLLGAGLINLRLAHAFWPRQWSQARPPGLGFVAPAPRYVAAAVLLGLAMPYLGGWLTSLLARDHAVPQDVKELGGQASLGLRIALTLTVASIGPLVEELLFRGVLLSALLRHLRAFWAALASAALFALVHLPDLRWLWYALPNLVLLGLALAWLRLRAGSLWPSVIAHGCNNLVAMLAMFVSLHQPG